MEGILLSLIVVLFHVLKEFILRGDFGMMFEVIGHLDEVVRQPIEVDGLRDRTPSEVIVGDCVVAKLLPKV